MEASSGISVNDIFGVTRLFENRMYDRSWASDEPPSAIVANDTTLFYPYPTDRYGGVKGDVYKGGTSASNPEGVLLSWDENPHQICLAKSSDGSLIVAYHVTPQSGVLYGHSNIGKTEEQQWASGEFPHNGIGNYPPCFAITPSGDEGVIVTGNTVRGIDMTVGSLLWTRDSLKEEMTGVGLLLGEQGNEVQVIMTSLQTLYFLTAKGNKMELAVPSLSGFITAMTTDWPRERIIVGTNTNGIHVLDRNGKGICSASLGNASGKEKKGIAAIAVCNSATKGSIIAAMSYRGHVALLNGAGMEVWRMEYRDGRFTRGGSLALTEDAKGDLHLFMGYHLDKNAYICGFRFSTVMQNIK